jgi:amidase
LNEISNYLYLQCNKKLRDYKTKFAEAWKGLDALICPSAPSASFPHDFNVYWGYTSLFNILDYPSTILPLKNFRISELCDPIDTSYQPLSGNPYDKPNHKLCKWSIFPKCEECQLMLEDHPKTFMGMPMTVQIVGRPFDDEELIEVTAVIDSVVNDSTA